MFQLIAVVIAILLMVVAVLGAMWFGGGVFTESRVRALYAEYMNAASQIDGAMKLYYQENAAHVPGQDAELLGELVTQKYLKDPPRGDWRISSDEIYIPIDGVNICEAMNRFAGFDTSETECPACDDPSFGRWPGCTLTEAEPTP